MMCNYEMHEQHAEAAATVTEHNVLLHSFIHLLLLFLLFFFFFFFLLTYYHLPLICLFFSFSSSSLMYFLHSYLHPHSTAQIEVSYLFLRDSNNRIIPLLFLNVQKATYLTCPPLPNSFWLSLSFNYYILPPSSSFPSPSISSPFQQSNHSTTQI